MRPGRRRISHLKSEISHFRSPREIRTSATYTGKPQPRSPIVNKSLARLALLIATAAPLAATAQKAPDAAPAAQKPAAADAHANPLDQVLPEVNFNGVALGDVVDFLRDVAPGFKVVVVRSPGATEADDPRVSVRLKQASLGQVLEILSRAYPVELSSVRASRPTDTDETILTIKPSPASRAETAGPGAGVRVYHLATITAGLHSNTAEAAVPKNFTLSPEKGEDAGTFNKRFEAKQAEMAKALAAAREADAKAQKESLADVLSLCKAAIEQGSNGAKASMQVHEPTQTLIFKGTPEQEAALEDVLNALDPNRGHSDRAVVRGHDESIAEATAAVREHLQQTHQRELDELKADEARVAQRAEDRVNELLMRTRELEDRLAKQQAESVQQTREMERLKIRLEAAEKASAAGSQGESKGKDSGSKQ